MQDSKEQFYYELNHKIDEEQIVSSEFIEFITAKGDTSGFYELCSKFTDISLNAPKAPDPKTCEVRACFQFTDINIAKAAFAEYVDTHQLKDIEGLLEAVRLMHPFAVAWDDPRSKSGMVRPEGYDWNSIFAGKYHNFCQLPDEIWDQIKDEIQKEMTQ